MHISTDAYCINPPIIKDETPVSRSFIDMSYVEKMIVKFNAIITHNGKQTKEDDASMIKILDLRKAPGMVHQQV